MDLLPCTSRMWLFIMGAGLVQALVTSGMFMKRRTVQPEATMDVGEMISFRGYPSETYEVVTDDGCILSINRIPHGKRNNRESGPRPAVFLQHGLLGSSSNWVFNMDYNSLGFILADAGYDVWLGNTRGNTWSNKHINYTEKHQEFWLFSFDEMAKYDLPASINFVLNKTGQEKIFYVGHSEGTTMAFIAFSTMPHLAKKIKMFFALAPVVTVKYLTNTALTKLAMVPEPKLKKMFGTKQFLAQDRTMKWCATSLCNRFPMDYLCGTAFFLLHGFNVLNFNASRIDVYLSHFPAGTSIQNMLHWVQIVKAGKFKGFDWGSKEANMAHHNQSTPPFHNVQRMTLPTAVWSGGNDWIADSKDMALLLPQIPNLVYHKDVPEWQHLDFIIGYDAPQRMYIEIMDLMQTYK
ncbi:putative lysosomal acid lipase/cholesteryl ester hydrolase [Podarcis raffonei]|uniref:putative lysosomal acid lipase/cholesteryl ester hydrolase n=1 Tax=Podarcis raffonei TaxID=65483 RepID=UPI0023293753|nr:putative lysosomal acid lipase/cholesteryl ester hydrolase [Podarcis raffonei]